MVLHVKEHWVVAQGRRVGRDVGNYDHISGVLHEHASVAVVGMVVVRPRRDHHIGVPSANSADDLLPDGQVREQLAVMVIENFVFDTEAPAGLFRLSTATLCERTAADVLVTGIAVRDGYELDLMPSSGELGGQPSGTEIAIVGVSAEHDHV